MSKGMGRGREGGKKLDRKTARSVFIRLFSYLMKYKLAFFGAIALTLLSNQLSLLGPKYSGDAIDAITAAGAVDFAAVHADVIKMAVCYGASAILSYLLAILMIHISQKIVYTMRRQLFDKLMSLPVGYFDKHATGDIVSRISYDIDTVNASLSQDIVQVMTSLYTVIGSLIFMWRISRPLILVFAVTVPISVMFTRYRSKKVRPLFSARSRKLGELNGYAEQMLSGGKTIRAYSRENETSKSFSKRNTETMDAYYTADYYGAAMGPSVNFINNISVSLIMVFGGILYMYSQNGTFRAGSLFFITLGGVAQFVQYSRKFAGPINEFANIINEFQSAFSAAERVFRIIDEQPEQADSAEAGTLENAEGDVEFSHVNFGYTDKQVLHDISIHAKPGQTVAVVGPTGAGKTTLISLLMRFYDPTDGCILADGKDVRLITRRSLRKAYTMMLQDTWLFHGTVYENIAYGNADASAKDVYEAAKSACIDKFIQHLPNGYDTMLSDGGTNLSKGQRQLIAIARAMLSKSSMLILDEATSNVDSHTEALVQQAMSNLMRGRTCFVIAHRLSTVKNADIILVMQNGKITESGTHDELMRQNGFYAALYNFQFM